MTLSSLHEKLLGCRMVLLYSNWQLMLRLARCSSVNLAAPMVFCLRAAMSVFSIEWGGRWRVEGLVMLA